MTSSRWLIVIAAIAILAVVGGTAWRGSSHKEEPAEGQPTKSSKRPGFGSDRRGTNGKDWPTIDPVDGIGTDELPAHLRSLVARVERLADSLTADSLTEDYTLAELLGARAELEPLLAKLTVEELSLLIRFYQEPNVDWEVRSQDFVVPQLFRLLGQKAPEGVPIRILAGIDKFLASSPSGLDLEAPYGLSRRFSDWASMYEGWASLDPQAALAGWDQLHSDLKQNENVEGVGYLDGFIRSSLMRGWAAHDPEAASLHLLENFGTDTPSLLEGYFDGLQPDAPWNDLVSTFHTELGEDFEDDLPEALGSWAVVDHEAMFDWMEGQDLNPDGLHEALFGEWFGRDTTSTAVDWLRDSASSLTAGTRAEAVEAALAFQTHRLEEVLPIISSLDRDTRTWNLIRGLANVPLSGGMAERPSNNVEVALPTLELYQIRALLDQLAAPDELRQRVEDAYASGAANE